MRFRPTRGNRRPGAVIPWLIVTAPVLLAVFGLAVEVTSLRHRQVELQNALDAAATAAADQLGNDDRFLSSRADLRDAVWRDVRLAGQRYGAFNLVSSKPLEIDPNPRNFTDGELVLGHLDAARSKLFAAEGRSAFNAVHVAVKRGGAAAQATAMIDHDVIGFQHMGSHPLPIVPLAIRTDPCPPGLDKPSIWAQKDPRSWEYQILARKGTDDWTATEAGPRPGSDQIPEMKLVISSTGNNDDDNGQLTGIGVKGIGDACRQIRLGISEADLQSRGGRLVLDDGLARRPPDQRLVLPQLSPTDTEVQALAQALRGIIGSPRIWMLYEQQTAPSGDTVLVRGFVAARVLHVEVKAIAKDSDKAAQQLIVTLQPCRLTTPAALTDRSRRDLGMRTLLNPYLGRVRLVE